MRVGLKDAASGWLASSPSGTYWKQYSLTIRWFWEYACNYWLSYTYYYTVQCLSKFVHYVRTISSNGQTPERNHLHGMLDTAIKSFSHYNDVTMGSIASQITSLTVVYSAVYSGANQRKHQSSASLAFVRGIHRGPVNSPHKWPVTQKMFPFDDVIMTPATVANTLWISNSM